MKKNTIKYIIVSTISHNWLLLFDASLLKNNNLNENFKPLEDDLIILENSGIDIEFNNQLINLKGTISIYCADSIGANSLAGLVKIFRHNVAGK